MELIVSVKKFMEGRNIMGYRSQRRFHGKGRLERRAVIIWEKRKLSGKRQHIQMWDFEIR